VEEEVTAAKKKVRMALGAAFTEREDMFYRASVIGEKKRSPLRGGRRLRSKKSRPDGEKYHWGGN